MSLPRRPPSPLLRFAASRLLGAYGLERSQVSIRRLAESVLEARLRALPFLVVAVSLLPAPLLRTLSVRPPLVSLLGLCAAVSVADEPSRTEVCG